MDFLGMSSEALGVTVLSFVAATATGGGAGRSMVIEGLPDSTVAGAGMDGVTVDVGGGGMTTSSSPNLSRSSRKARASSFFDFLDIVVVVVVGFVSCMSS